MKAAPTMAVKELNKRALTKYLYANGPATKQVLGTGTRTESALPSPRICARSNRKVL